MGYVGRIKEALLGLDERYANSVQRYMENPKSPQWMASNIPMQAAYPVRELMEDTVDGFGTMGERMDYARDVMGAVGTRYLVPVTTAGLSLAGLTKAFGGEEEY